MQEVHNKRRRRSICQPPVWMPLFSCMSHNIPNDKEVIIKLISWITLILLKIHINALLDPSQASRLHNPCKVELCTRLSTWHWELWKHRISRGISTTKSFVNCSVRKKGLHLLPLGTPSSSKLVSGKDSLPVASSCKRKSFLIGIAWSTFQGK